MPDNPRIHHRRSIRLKGYDYTRAGVYYVTLVTQGRACLFGEIVDNTMRLNRAGQVVRAEWQRLASAFLDVQLDAFVIMPNHVHGIIVITEPAGQIVGATHPFSTKPSDGNEPLPDDPLFGYGGSPRPSRPHGPPDGSLGAMIGQFKSRVTKRLKLAVPIWQRNYYEHIIRNEAEWEHTREYIQENPRRWEEDEEHV